jgi:hypothetical protein
MAKTTRQQGDVITPQEAEEIHDGHDVADGDLDTAPLGDPGAQPPYGSAQVPGGFAVQHEQNNLNDVRWSNPDVGLKGVEPAVNNQSEVEQFAALLSNPAIAGLLDRFINDAVSVKVQEAVSEQSRDPLAMAEILARETRDRQRVVFLKHYKHRTFKGIHIKEFVMVNGKPDYFQPTGNDIVFRDGDFYAQTENQVAFLDWKMARNAISSTGRVVGGDPSLYVVEDKTTQA